jgi:hypothetical protein
MLELINEKRSEYMMAESLYLDDGDGYTEDVLLPYPSQAPIPAPPALSKFEVYNDPSEFADIDQIAISVRKQLRSLLQVCNVTYAISSYALSSLHLCMHGGGERCVQGFGWEA